MEAIASQTYAAVSFVSRAEYRGQFAQRICGDRGIRYAEAFQRFEPRVAKPFDGRVGGFAAVGCANPAKTRASP